MEKVQLIHSYISNSEKFIDEPIEQWTVADIFGEIMSDFGKLITVGSEVILQMETLERDVRPLWHRFLKVLLVEAPKASGYISKSYYSFNPENFSPYIKKFVEAVKNKDLSDLLALNRLPSEDLIPEGAIAEQAKNTDE